MAPIMAPDRKGGDRVGKKRVKRAKKIMPLSEKVRLLDRLALGESAASVGRLYGVNESTVRYIKKSEVAIRASVSECVPRSARASFYTRDPHMEKMERALNLWIEDQTRMGVPLSGVDIRDRALRFYERSEQSSCGESSDNSGKKSRTPFAASKGWFENFKKRYSLHNVKLVGESMDTVADEGPYRVLRKKVVDEEDDDCKPAQVFDVDEMGLFWKKMPTRTYISKEERSGLKAPSDGPSLLCAHDVPCVPSPLDGDSSRVAGVARAIGADEGLEDLQGADHVVLIESRTEEFPEEDLEERIKAGDGDSDDDDGEEGEEEDENASGKSRLNLKTLSEIMQLGSELTDKVLEADPLVERSVRFKREMDAVLNPYREVYKDLWRKAKQIPITSYLQSHSSAACDSTTPTEPLPGTSSAKDRPAPPRDLPVNVRKRDSRHAHHHHDDEHH